MNVMQAVAISTSVARLMAQSTMPKRSAPAQLLPFSHKQHVSRGLKCKDCHAMPDPGDNATLPPAGKCMACHTMVKKDSPPIQELTDYYNKKEEVPWKRAYRLPEYVFFSHSVHLTKAKATCETCYGPVQERGAMQKRERCLNGRLFRMP